MGKQPDYPSKPFQVGLVALRDKKFFEALLKNPAAALEELAKSGKLDLSEEDRRKVIQLVARANAADWNPLEQWEQYKATFIWGGGWPAGWVE